MRGQPARLGPAFGAQGESTLSANPSLAWSMFLGVRRAGRAVLIAAGAHASDRTPHDGRHAKVALARSPASAILFSPSASER